MKLCYEAISHISKVIKTHESIFHMELEIAGFQEQNRALNLCCCIMATIGSKKQNHFLKHVLRCKDRYSFNFFLVYMFSESVWFHIR